MLNKISFLSFLSAFLLSAVFFSCSDDVNTFHPQIEKVKKYVKIDSNVIMIDSVKYYLDYNFGEKRTLSKDMGTNALPCGYKYIDAWTPDHFKPIEGKLLGIWPVNYHSPAYLQKYKDTLGYTGLLIGPDMYEYNEALQAGFLPENLMISIIFPPPIMYILMLSII